MVTVARRQEHKYVSGPYPSSVANIAYLYSGKFIDFELLRQCGDVEKEEMEANLVMLKTFCGGK